MHPKRFMTSDWRGSYYVMRSGVKWLAIHHHEETGGGGEWRRKGNYW
jgi:hypothetical protein